VRSRWRVWLGGRGSQLRNRSLDVPILDLAIRGSHGFLPYLALLVRLKDGQGADLLFVNRLDFTRGHHVHPGGQIGYHLGTAYQVVRIRSTYPPFPPAIIVEGFVPFPVESAALNRE